MSGTKGNVKGKYFVFFSLEHYVALQDLHAVVFLVDE